MNVQMLQHAANEGAPIWTRVIVGGLFLLSAVVLLAGPISMICLGLRSDQ